MNRPTFAVHVSSSPHASQRIRMAAQLAASADAHLVGVASILETDPPYMNCVAGEAATALGAYLASVRRRAEQDLSNFETLARDAGVQSWEGRIVEDEPEIALCLQARYSDLLVVGQPDPDDAAGDPADLPGYVLLNSGRPVLVCPYAGSFDSAGTRCLVAWDGSIEAARAVSGALPLLCNADEVRVTVVETQIGARVDGDEPGADIAIFLARHGLKVEVVPASGAADFDVGEAILSEAADYGADLLVMGGYGHSRLRETILGGVTATLLRSMTLPVLLAH